MEEVKRGCNAARCLSASMKLFATMVGGWLVTALNSEPAETLAPQPLARSPKDPTLTL